MVNDLTVELGRPRSRSPSATAPAFKLLTRGFAECLPRFQNDRSQIHARSRLGSPLVQRKMVFKCWKFYAIWKS